MAERSIFYFCYGSNMLEERMRMEGINAEFHCIAHLKGYRLIFNKLGKRWGGGCGASLQKTEADEDIAWGVVYKLSLDELPILAERERTYTKENVRVHVQGREIDCITYIYYAVGEELLLTDAEKIPSRHYLSVLASGARQHGIPEDYCRFLENFPRVDVQGEIPYFNDLMKACGNKLQLL